MCQDCLTLVRHDLETLALLSPAAASQKPPLDASDRKCTLLFYMACIYLRALAHQRGKAIERHADARTWLNTEPDLVAIARPYRMLEERSRDARYDGRRFSQPELQGMHRWFCAIRDHLVPLLKATGLAIVPVVEPLPYL